MSSLKWEDLYYNSALNQKKAMQLRARYETAFSKSPMNWSDNL